MSMSLSAKSGSDHENCDVKSQSTGPHILLPCRCFVSPINSLRVYITATFSMMNNFVGSMFSDGNRFGSLFKSAGLKLT